MGERDRMRIRIDHVGYIFFLVSMGLLALAYFLRSISATLVIIALLLLFLGMSLILAGWAKVNSLLENYRLGLLTTLPKDDYSRHQRCYPCSD